jgi:flagellar protein FliS
MNPSSPHQNYLKNEILSAQPVQLIGILYRAALDAIGGARLALISGEIAARSSAISQAVSILHELSMSVDRASGGKLGTDLVELYDYMQRRLLQVNVDQIIEPLEEVERLLVVLLEGWRDCEGKLCAPVEHVTVEHLTAEGSRPSLSVSY